MLSRLKDSTIFNALDTLLSLGKVKSVTFARAYWFDKEMTGIRAFTIGRNLLFKLRKYGYVIVFRCGFIETSPFFFTVSQDGYKFLFEYQAKNGGSYD